LRLVRFQVFQVFSGSFGVGEFVVGIVGEFELDDLAAVRRVGRELAEEQAEFPAGGVEFLRVEGAGAKHLVGSGAEFESDNAVAEQTADAAVDAVDLLEQEVVAS